MPRTSAAASGRSIVFAVVVSLAAPVLGYAAVRNAALDGPPSAVAAASALPPPSLLPQLKALIRVARRPDQKLPQGANLLVRRAAVVYPLAYEPYFIAARVEEQAGRYGRATVLMEEARRRRPNATSVRVALLGYYSLANAYQKAIDEADMAMRISGRSTELILPAFAKLVALDPKARQAIAVALARKPPWREAFLQAAAVAKIKPEDAKALVADIRRLVPSREPQAEEAFLVRALVDAGRAREAFSLWQSYRPPVARATDNVIFDPTFTGATAMQPFAWTFQSGQEGTGEIAKGGAGSRSMLEVDYFGDGEVVLAEQTIAARAGSYRLSTLLTGQSSAPDVRLVWQLSCLPSGPSLGRLELQPMSETMVRREAMITVPPSGCEVQSLALVGVPGDLSRTLSAQIAEVSLVPASAARTR